MTLSLGLCIDGHTSMEYLSKRTLHPMDAVSVGSFPLLVVLCVRFALVFSVFVRACVRDV